MKKVARYGLIALIVVALLIVSAGGYGVYVARSQFPQISGSVKLDGLKGSVEIIRDSFGVPHIYADTPDDLFRAQGYVHAQDRYFQMEFWRRIGQGRLAELFGPSALEQDQFIRTVGWHRVAAEEAKHLNPEMQLALDSYAAGVNGYALTHQGQLGLEFKVLGLIGPTWQPEVWKPENSLTWAKAMAWNLGGNLDTELLRMAITAKGGAALTEALLPPYPKDGPVIVPSTGSANASDRGEGMRSKGDERKSTLSPHPLTSSSPDTVKTTLHLLKSTRQLAETTGLLRENGIGSNNWVVAGSHTSTGKPILSNDPHLGVQMPSIWYQIGLHCRSISAACPYDVVGASFAGVPGVIIGHNARIAWGVTNVEPDTQDLVIEKPNPNNSDEFEYMGKFELSQVREEVINVAGKESVRLKVRVTRHGPVISDIFKPIKDLKLDQGLGQQVLVLQWTSLQSENLFNAVLKINQAQNWEMFREALHDWASPAQNFVYADIDGNIGYQMPGRIPIRKNSDGKAPTSGWNGDADWVSYIDFEKLPKLFNPKQGYIVTANNAVVDGQYPFLITHDWERGYRARRISELITSKEKLSVEDMTRFQMDSHATHADDLLPLLDSITLNSELAPALAALKAWDRVYTRDSVGATIFEAFWKHLAHNIFDDELGADLAKEVIDLGSPTKLAVKNTLAQSDAPWWDNLSTPNKETRDEIVAKSLTNAIAELKGKLGNDMAQWRWGKLHTITFQNQTLGKSGVAPIEALFNRGPFALDGATSTVNAENTNEEFTVRSHPSWRMVVDLGDFTKSVAVHPTGQSGHTLSPHYDDMMKLWLEGRTQAFLWQRTDVERGAEGVLRLEP